MQAEASVVADTPKAAKDGGPATPGRCMYQTPTENSLKAAAVIRWRDSLSRSVVAGQKEAAAALQVECQIRHKLHALRGDNIDAIERDAVAVPDVLRGLPVFPLAEAFKELQQAGDPAGVSNQLYGCFEDDRLEAVKSRKNRNRTCWRVRIISTILLHESRLFVTCRQQRGRRSQHGDRVGRQQSAAVVCARTSINCAPTSPLVSDIFWIVSILS